MKPIITFLTIISFQVASIMEKTVFLLCILVGSVSCKIPVDCQPDLEVYEICCLSRKSCQEIPVEPVKCDSPRICLTLPSEHESLGNGCEQNLDPPSLVTTIKERDDPIERNPAARAIIHFVSIIEPTFEQIFNSSRPQGVHQTIPTTVLRL